MGIPSPRIIETEEMRILRAKYNPQQSQRPAYNPTAKRTTGGYSGYTPRNETVVVEEVVSSGPDLLDIAATALIVESVLDICTDTVVDYGSSCIDTY